MMQQSQPYDSALKSLLEDHAAEIIPLLLPDARMLEELNDEILKPSLRADRVYRIWYRERPCILHIEFETGSDSSMAQRLYQYNGILLKKHDKPVLSLVVYPFHVSLPTSPLEVSIEEEGIVVFHFRVIALWELDAQYYLDNHAMGFYPLLPTMRNARCDILKRALDELREWYSDERRKLAARLLWFDLFLQRTAMVSAEDKEEVKKKLDSLDSLLEESRFVKRAEARGRVEGRVEGKVEGAVEALQQAVVEIVQGRFAPLTELARQKVVEIKDIKELHLLVKQVATARDEEVARWLLTLSAA
ncbi:MAG: Rpn family recombination-promoting nuclease/putative transposase [Ktedonobacteraceae bacterium]|nr:Rpn family recombination-promoting nuclease/putative transposase [Ktedonobacteraceae bacterium]